MNRYTIGCTIKPPFIWYIQKCTLIWIICFHFSFVFVICSSKMRMRHVMCDLFTEMVLSLWVNFNSRHLLLYDDWNLASLHLCNSKFRSFILLDALNNFLPLWSWMWMDRTSLICPSARVLFPWINKAAQLRLKGPLDWKQSETFSEKFWIHSFFSYLF